MAIQTSNHAWTIPEVGGSEDVWGSILNDFFGDLDAQIMLDGPLADRPDAANTDLKYYHSTDESEDTIYYNENDTWEVLSIGSDSGGGEQLSYVSGHSNWQDGLNNQEINRFELDSGQSFEVTSIQFFERGGGSANSSATVEVFDVDDASIVDSADLNTKSTTGGTSTSASTLIFRLTNGTSSNIDASVSVRGQFV